MVVEGVPAVKKKVFGPPELLPVEFMDPLFQVAELRGLARECMKTDRTTEAFLHLSHALRWAMSVSTCICKTNHIDYLKKGWMQTTETCLLREVGSAVERLVSIILPSRCYNFFLLLYRRY